MCTYNDGYDQRLTLLFVDLIDVQVTLHERDIKLLQLNRTTEWVDDERDEQERREEEERGERVSILHSYLRILATYVKSKGESEGKSEGEREGEREELIVFEQEFLQGVSTATTEQLKHRCSRMVQRVSAAAAAQQNVRFDTVVPTLLAPLVVDL
jgi:hypothetical protein